MAMSAILRRRKGTRLDERVTLDFCVAWEERLAFSETIAVCLRDLIGILLTLIIYPFAGMQRLPTAEANGQRAGTAQQPAPQALRTKA